MRPRANSNVVIEVVLRQYGEEVLTMARRGCSHDIDNARKLPEAFGFVIALYFLQFAIPSHSKKTKEDCGARGLSSHK